MRYKTTDLEALEQRTKAMAIPIKRAEKPEREVLLFELNNQEFIVETTCIKEVLKASEITPLPNVPPYIHGVINYRGEILAVVNVERILKLSHTSEKEIKDIIVLHNKKMIFGVAVNKVVGNIYYKECDIEKARFKKDSEKKYISAVLSDKRIMLDGNQLLEDNDLIVNNEK